MGDFCTIADVAAFLQLTIAYDDAACQRAITEASEVIRNYCGQQIELVEDDAITLDVRAGQNRLFLPELPVVQVTSVVEDGETLTAGSDEDYQLGEHGILYRVGQKWASGIQIVTITYDHGRATIPEDVVGVCTRAAARAYQAGLKSHEVDGVPGVTAKSLGDFSASFGAEAGGSGESVLGASAAPMLLRSEKAVLDRYRV